MSTLQESASSLFQLLPPQSTLRQHNQLSQLLPKLQPKPRQLPIQQIHQSHQSQSPRVLLLQLHAVPTPTTTDSASASARLASTSTTEPARPVLPAESTLAATLMARAPAILVSPTTAESAPNALKAHSGAPPPTSASSSAVKTPPTLPQLARVNATQDSASTLAPARPAPTTISSPADTA